MQCGRIVGLKMLEEEDFCEGQININLMQFFLLKFEILYHCENCELCIKIGAWLEFSLEKIMAPQNFEFF